MSNLIRFYIVYISCECNSSIDKSNVLKKFIFLTKSGSRSGKEQHKKRGGRGGGRGGDII